jgi:hypothetical protein
MYGKPYAGLPDVDLSQGAATAAWPSRWGTLGLGFAGFRAAGAKEERTFAASYGVTVLGRVRAGVTVKRLEQSYLTGSAAGAQNDPIFSGGTSRSAYDFDAGITADLGGPVKAGFSVRNIRQADLGLASRDAVRREAQGGLALDIPGWGLSAAGDLVLRESRPGSSSNASAFFGVEKAIYGKTLFLRGGANQDEFSGGMGFRRAGLGIDYGFSLSRTLSNDNSGTHQVQVTFRFNTSER